MRRETLWQQRCPEFIIWRPEGVRVVEMSRVRKAVGSRIGNQALRDRSVQAARVVVDSGSRLLKPGAGIQRWNGHCNHLDYV